MNATRSAIGQRQTFADDRKMQQWLTSAAFRQWLQQALHDPTLILASGNQGVVVRGSYQQHELAIKCASGSGLLLAALLDAAA